MKRTRAPELWPLAMVAFLLASAAGQIFPVGEQFAFYIGVAVGLSVAAVTMIVVPEDEA